MRLGGSGLQRTPCDGRQSSNLGSVSQHLGRPDCSLPRFSSWLPQVGKLSLREALTWNLEALFCFRLASYSVVEDDLDLLPPLPRAALIGVQRYALDGFIYPPLASNSWQSELFQPIDGMTDRLSQGRRFYVYLA